MLSKFVVFDLEFTKLVDQNWSDLHIACASTMKSDESFPYVWYDRTNQGISEFMSVATLSNFIMYLQSLSFLGYTIVTWGGAGTDFRVLWKEVPNLRQQILQMCLLHVDVPFASGMDIGMMMGLSASARAIGLEDKTVKSIEIPELWRTNKQLVLTHVSTDSYLTFMVVQNICNTNTLCWITQKGVNRCWKPVNLRKVQECLLLPLPEVPFQIPDHMNPKIISKWMFNDDG